MFDKESGLGERDKPVLVKAVVAESAIEAFNKSVLHGLSRLDVMKGDARRSSPEVKSFAGQGHFPSDEAATKLIYLALRNITKS